MLIDSHSFNPHKLLNDLPAYISNADPLLWCLYGYKFFSYIGDCVETDEVIASVLIISPETNMYYHQSLYQIQTLIQILLILRTKNG